MSKASMKEGGNNTELFLPEFDDTDDIKAAADQDRSYKKQQAAHDMAREKEFSDEDEEDDTTNRVMPEATTDQVFSAFAKTRVGMTDGSSKGYAVEIDGKQKVWRASEEAANMAAEKLKQALPDSTIEVVPFSAISEYGDDIDIVGDKDAAYDRMQAAHDIRRSGEEELAKMMAQQDEEDDTILSKIIRQKGEEDAIAGSIY